MSAPILHRIIPLTGTEANRQAVNTAGLLIANELHTTSQGRQFLKLASGDLFIGPSVFHGGASEEAAMLAINATSVRGCWPTDECLREDTGTIWKCISNNGTSPGDWIDTNPSDLAPSTYYEPVSDGDSADPEIVFAGRDVVMVLKT